MKHRCLLTTCAAGALSIAATGVLAQAAPAPRPAPSQQAQSATTLGEIVVTAERREANLQEVPEAVTAFTSKERSVKGIETVQDMTDFTPGFTYSSQLDRPAMRGLGRNTNIYLADSSVGVYYDDFFSNSTFLVGRDDMLIDQVEVLLGPQGTLYGRNAIGGLINTLSKHPTDTLQGEMRVIYGNYGYTKVEGTISGPITDHLSFRLSAYDDNQNRGWLNNIVPGMPSEGGVRHDPYVDLQLEYKTDKDDLWLDSYAVGFNNDRGGPGSLLGTPTGGPYDTALTTQGNLVFNPNFPYGGGAVPGSVVGQIGTNNPALGNIRDFAHALTTDINVDKAYAVVLHYTHHFDGFDMKYIGGYSQYHYQLTTSYFYNSNSPITQYQIPTVGSASFGANGQPVLTGCDAVANSLGYPAALLASGFVPPTCDPLTVYPQQQFSFTTQTDWFSHELLFQSTGNGPVQWVAGLYYFNEWDNNPETFQEAGQAQIKSPLTLAGTPAIPNPSGDYLLLDYQDRIQSLGEYAQIDWHITPTIKITGGIRYTQDWKHAQEETRYIDFSNAILNPATWGSLLPAFDITPLETDPLPGKGICGLPFTYTSGPFAGDLARCLSDKSSAVTGTAGIEWTPDRDTLVYARYNRGYKAVAFNAGFVGNQPEAAPEHVDDFEVGLKKTFGHTFVLDADAFYYNYSNDQVPIGVPVCNPTTGCVTLTEFINVPKAISDGIEIQAIWSPIRDLELSLTYGLDHTDITSKCVADPTSPTGVAGACYVDADDTAAVQPGARPVGPSQGGNFVQAVNGSELPQAPENKIAANGVYTFHFEPGDLALSATFIWKDKSYGEIFTRPYYEAPSWDQVNLRATWSGDHDRYEVVLYVNNLFNSLGYDAAGGSGFLATQPVGGGPSTPLTSYDLTPPRQYGVEVHYKF
jgi:iron complex outermembrane receptor protein